MTSEEEGKDHKQLEGTEEGEKERIVLVGCEGELKWEQLKDDKIDKYADQGHDFEEAERLAEEEMKEKYILTMERARPAAVARIAPSAAPAGKREKTEAQKADD